ncbi:MAG: S8 family serine peptidase, partial [Planctomycetales bacterium]|nr:S8 family serine peptidase [Planctomycetales bacterium]
MRKNSRRKERNTSRIESLESREVMSADPLADLLGGGLTHHVIEEDTAQYAQPATTVDDGMPLATHHEAPPMAEHHDSPDFTIDWDTIPTIDDQLEQIDQFLNEAHNQTGWNTVQTNYGLTGAGQTIAVIDSGVAWDQAALGGGFGSNYRVVGGWDFTNENDADPYDDGPSGSHGTHVAGIAAANGAYKGVATGADIVALRVFNDAGDGYFSWILNALNWVKANVNSFENPITAVNLSLGVPTWNASTTPSWANLETAFADLENMGVFISVSAGNSYTDFNAPGLSYPASSPYVVPVMSNDDNGLLSYYSQRHSRAIAVPGRSIVSTVPDWKGNNDGTHNDWATKSGTSMAAPYMAGASMLIREAMEFAGQGNVTQDQIYSVVNATADQLYDTSTSAYYNRLNLSAAIDSVMPADDFGSTIATANALGSLTGQATTRTGHIAKLNDVDVFSFTASATGSTTFSLSNLTHELSASWIVYNGSGQSIQTGSGSEITFDVNGGQGYYVSLATSNGLGHYSFSATLEGQSQSAPPVDWGTITYNQYASLASTGELLRHVVAGQNGTLSIAAAYNTAEQAVGIQLYNASNQLVGSKSGANGAARLDLTTTAGTEYFVKFVGVNSDIDVTLLNLVNASGSTVAVGGTSGNDTFVHT